MHETRRYLEGETLRRAGHQSVDDLFAIEAQGHGHIHYRRRHTVIRNRNQVIDAYFDAIRGKDIDALMELYARKALFILPDGREFEGADAVREMHSGVFAASAPTPSPGLRIIGENAAAVEIEARLPDGSVRHTTNHYSLDNDGKIERLSVYTKT